MGMKTTKTGRARRALNTGKPNEIAKRMRAISERMRAREEREARMDKIAAAAETAAAEDAQAETIASTAAEEARKLL